MIEKQDKKRLISNFLSLMSLQGVNYILPLLTFPYLVRVLGVDNFGLLAFATAFIAYFNIITSYGFDLTATKEVSIHRDNHDKLVEIYSSVMMIKFALIILSFIVMCVIVFSFERLSKDWEIYFLSFGVVVGQALFPVWLFQGLERMRYITYINILAKTIFTAAIFIFVHDQQDYFWVPLLTSAGYIIAGGYSLWIVNKIVGLKFKLQSKGKVLFYLNDGWHIFISQIYVGLYTTINILILGLFTNNTIVGYYAISEKIITAVGGMFAPVNQVLFPYLTSLHHKQKDLFTIIIRKVAMIFIAISIFLVGMMQLFSTEIITLVSGNYNHHIYEIYKIFVFTIITMPFGAYFTNLMVIKNLQKELQSLLKNIFLLNLVSAPITIYTFGAIGLAYSVLILQVYVIFRCYIKPK